MGGNEETHESPDHKQHDKAMREHLREEQHRADCSRDLVDQPPPEELAERRGQERRNSEGDKVRGSASRVP